MSEASEVSVDFLALAARLLDAAPLPSPASQARQQQEHGAPRLMISKISVENFKSYAGKATLGPFHSRFTSVVGPNGSGKSNVIDALLFVFGYKASRMRQDSFAHLIHKSAAFPSLQECSVTIHFQEIVDGPEENSPYQILPGSDFTVTHAIRRNGNGATSSYRLNDKSVKMSDVQARLKQKGVDIDNNRFLILQGEVEQISLMKPKAAGPGDSTGMLEYLEDIIGTNQYVECIEFVGKRIDGLNEERSEKLNRVKLCEREREALEPAMKEAKEFLGLQQKKLTTQCQIQQLAYQESSAALAVSEKRLLELDSSLTAERSRLESTSSELDDLSKEFNQIKSSHDSTHGDLERCKAEFQAFERKDVKFREDLNHKKAAIKKAQAKAAKLRQANQEIKEKMENETAQKEALEAKIAEGTTKRDQSEKKLEELFDAVRGATEPIRGQLEVLNKQLRPGRGKLQEAQRLLTDAKNEAALINERENEARRVFQESKQASRDNENEIQEKTMEVRQNANLTELAKTRHNEALKTLESAKQREGELVKRKHQLQSMLEEKSADSAADRSRDLVLNTLKKAKIPGFEGRLGDLGQIDQKFDCAISTACAQLNHVVVKTMKAAQEAIKILKKTNAGRVTCIVLEKLEENGVAQAMARPFTQTPEGAQRLFDLVQSSKEEYRTAFYFALKDTLVCNDLTAANRIAFSAPQQARHRVVTLDGKLIEKAGTMSGGGAQVSKGAMRIRNASGRTTEALSEISEDFKAEAVQAELSALEGELSKKKQEISALENELKALEKTMASGELSRKKAAMALEQLRSDSAALQQRIQSSELNINRSPQDERRLSELLESQAQHEKSVVKAQKECEKLESEIARLEQSILDAGGAKLRAQKELVDSETSKLAALQSERNRLAVSVEGAEKRLLKNDREAGEFEAEAAKTQADFDSLSSLFKQLEEDALQVMEAFTAAQGDLKAKEEALQAISTQFEAKKSLVSRLQSLIVDVEARSEEFHKAAKENRQKQKQWENQIRASVKKIKANARLSDVGNSGRGEAEAVDERALQIPLSDSDARALGLFSLAELSQLKRSDLEYSAALVEDQLNAMKPNMKAIEDFAAKDAEFQQRVRSLDECTQRRDSLRKVFEALRKRRLEEFMSAFTFISLKLKEMYQMLTLGGDAELELLDTLDPFSEGIVFSVRPPKKSWKNIQNLSGGEKTLSSLALVFALHQFKPTPLYVMDEIDAALDFKNVSIVANYIKERTKNAQFLIISLRNNMFELADRLVGIYKTSDCTKSITIDPSKFSVPQAPVSHSHSKVDPSEGSMENSRVPAPVR